MAYLVPGCQCMCELFWGGDRMGFSLNQMASFSQKSALVPSGKTRGPFLIFLFTNMLNLPLISALTLSFAKAGHAAAVGCD